MSPAKSPRISNTNPDKPSTSCTTNTSNESNEQSTSSPPQPYKAGNMKVHVPKTTKDTHVGPRSIIKEEIRLDGISRSIIANINDTCQNCEREGKEKSFAGKFKKIKKDWTYGKCYLLALIIILIQILVLIFLYNTRTGTKQNEANTFDPQRISWMNNGLRFGFLRNNWTLFKGANDCSYKCPKLKSKIRFFNVSPKMHFCLAKSFDVSACDGYLASVMRGSEEDYVTDTYYNYFLFEAGIEIKEGRSLTCPHDEPFLKEDHSEIITVGIFYGGYGKLKDDEETSLRVVDTISDLVTNLKETKMLTKNFVLELQDTWNSSFILERLTRVPDIQDRITFNRYGLHKNFEIVDPEEKVKNLTLEKIISNNYTNLDDLGIVTFPSIWNEAFPGSNISWISTESFRYYLTVIYERRNLDFCKREPITEECLSVLNGYYKNDISFYNESVGNYFLFSHIRRVIILMPQNYPRNRNNHTYFATVTLIHDSYNGSSVLNEDTFVWFYNAYESVQKDIEKRVNYSIIYNYTWP